MASKKLTILFTPLDAWGHINPDHGVAAELKERGHRVVFALDKSFKGVLTPFGFEEIILESATEADQGDFLDFIETNAKYLYEESIEGAKKFFLPAAIHMFKLFKDHDKQYKAIIDSIKPDVIITDNFACSPTLHGNKIPWVWLFPAAPHYALYDDKLPPYFSGFSLNGNRSDWDKYNKEWNAYFKELRDEIVEFSESNGGPSLETNRLHPISPHLNVIYWPKELLYEEVLPLPDNWIRVENILRITNQTFEVPKQLTQRPGKLILLSMGTIGCGIIDLMIKLTTILAKSKHKFIVSTGPVYQSHELPANMWGKAYLPQTAIYPLVDLVITHGGNNTVNEIFYFGKPMLVLPLFSDQLDNAQRVSETGLGLRLNPFHCTESELLSAVDRLVSDKALAERMTAIGNRIRNTNDKKFLSERIENLVN